LVGVADTIESRAKRAKTFGFTSAFMDYRQMIEQTRPDILYVLINFEVMFNIISDLIRLRLPLFIEKSAGNSADEVRQLAGLAAQHGTPTFVAFNRRWMPVVQRAKALLRDLGLGPVYYASGDFARAGRTEGRFAFHTGIHSLDLLRYFVGEVSTARTVCPMAADRTEEIACVSLEFASGALGQVSILPQVGVALERFRFYGHEWTLHLSLPMEWTIDYPGWLELYRAEYNRVDAGDSPLIIDDRRLPSSHISPIEATGFYGESRYFLDCVTRGEQPKPDLADASVSVALAECTTLGLDFE
jgi:predicted dehydrogenase